MSQIITFQEILQLIKVKTELSLVGSSSPDLLIKKPISEDALDTFSAELNSEGILITPSSGLSSLYAIAKFKAEPDEKAWTSKIKRYIPKVSFRGIWFDGQSDISAATIATAILLGCNAIVSKDKSVKFEGLSMQSYYFFEPDNEQQKLLENRTYLFDRTLKDQLICNLKVALNQVESNLFWPGSSISEEVFFDPRFRQYSVAELYLQEVQLFEEVCGTRDLLYHFKESGSLKSDEGDVFKMLSNMIKMNTKILLHEKHDFINAIDISQYQELNPWVVLLEKKAPECIFGGLLKIKDLNEAVIEPHLRELAQSMWRCCSCSQLTIR